MKAKTIIILFCAVTAGSVLSLTLLNRQQRRSGSESVAGEKCYEVHGTVRALDLAAKTIRITHEEIPNYMPAMTMPFTVKEKKVLKGLAPGDRVSFELVVTEDDSWIRRVEKIASAPSGSTASAEAPGALEDLERERVHEGEVVPDFNLLDQNGQPVSLAQFRGKAVLLTFIYTRCPLPNFCPLMSKNFSELEHRLTEEFAGKFHLLSVTMDPEFDRPAVLKDYAARYDANSNDWTFCTGDTDQIQFVAGLMGLYYVRENGLISHDVRTALIAPDGRLVHLWKSNFWTPYEVQRAVRETLTGARDLATR